MNNILGFMNQFNQFRNMFNGDPQQQVKQLLDSGKVSQSQYDAAVQKTNELIKLIHNAHV